MRWEMGGKLEQKNECFDLTTSSCSLIFFNWLHHVKIWSCVNIPSIFSYVQDKFGANHLCWTEIACIKF
jgi:hypothetical protein